MLSKPIYHNAFKKRIHMILVGWYGFVDNDSAERFN